MTNMRLLMLLFGAVDATKKLRPTMEFADSVEAMPFVALSVI
jgi:hypothetical protein